MSMSLVNKLFVGKSFLWNDKTYTIVEVTNISDEHRIVNVTLNYNNEVELAGTFTYDEWNESVMK